MIDPYIGKGFFGFFGVLIQRVFSLFHTTLYMDELQIAVLICLTLLGAIVGPFLIARNMAMVANALSHTILLGIGIAYLIFFISGATNIQEMMDIKVLFLASIISAFCTLITQNFLKSFFKIQQDAGIGFVFTFFLALGVILVSFFSHNAHVGTELIMGNIDAVDLNHLKTIFLISLINCFIFLIFRRGFLISTFDRESAFLSGFRPKFYDMLIVCMTAFTTIASFRAVGIFTGLAFLIVPSLMALKKSVSLNKVMVIAFLFGMMISIGSVALSRAFFSWFNIGLSTGGILMVFMTLGLILSVIKPQYKCGAK